MLGTRSTTDVCLQIATINLKMNLMNECSLYSTEIFVK